MPINAEKSYKQNQNRPINRDTTPVQNMSPSNEKRAGLGAWQKKYKHHILAPTAGTRCAIFPKLCTVIELVEAIKKVSIIFDTMHSLSLTGCTEKFGLIDRRAVSQQ